MNDVVFVLRNPEVSLKALKQTLSHFGKVSGYRINEGKSIIFGMNIDKVTKQTIQGFDCTSWKRSDKYLGINFVLPLTNEALINSNLVPLVKSIKQKLHSWRCLRLSWFGQIAVVKIKVLPQLLFILWSAILCLSKQKILEGHRILFGREKIQDLRV